MQSLLATDSFQTFYCSLILAGLQSCRAAVTATTAESSSDWRSAALQNWQLWPSQWLQTTPGLQGRRDRAPCVVSLSIYYGDILLSRLLDWSHSKAYFDTVKIMPTNWGIFLPDRLRHWSEISMLSVAWWGHHAVSFEITGGWRKQFSIE